MESMTSGMAGPHPTAGSLRRIADALEGIKSIMGDQADFTLVEEPTIDSPGEAIAFAKKYLEDRKEQWMKHTETQLDDIPSWFIEKNNSKIWNIAVDYILDDIIPYLYGEALD